MRAEICRHPTNVWPLLCAGLRLALDQGGWGLIFCALYLTCLLSRFDLRFVCLQVPLSDEFDQLDEPVQINARVAREDVFVEHNFLVEQHDERHKAVVKWNFVWDLLGVTEKPHVLCAQECENIFPFIELALEHLKRNRIVELRLLEDPHEAAKQLADQLGGRAGPLNS